jgi:hypothetical protein
VLDVQVSYNSYISTRIPISLLDNTLRYSIFFVQLGYFQAVPLELGNAATYVTH